MTHSNQAQSRQVSSAAPDKTWILSVLAKRTYQIVSGQRCSLADEQLQLQEEVDIDPENEDLLLSDTDLIPYKLATDVVIKGNAYAMGAQTHTRVSAVVGQHKKSVLVFGDRRCLKGQNGQPLFSDPQPFEKIPLTFDRAYGGRDAVAEKDYKSPVHEAAEWMPDSVTAENTSPYRYPRNPIGRGYLMEPTAEALEQLELPNLEDALDPLTPERLPVGEPGRWLRMPLPQAFDWMHYSFFPRLVFLGILPSFAPEDSPPAEVLREFAPADLMEVLPPWEKLSPRCTNGASLGLQLPYLTGDEQCVLTNMHPQHPVLAFQLPADRPKIWTDGRNGKMNPTEPVIHTIIIEPEEDRLSIVWRGSAPALRPYFPEEIESMPFRVEWHSQ